jgi:hypothetical protein
MVKSAFAIARFLGNLLSSGTAFKAECGDGRVEERIGAEGSICPETVF